MIKIFMSYGMNGRTEKEQKESRARLRKRVEEYFKTDTVKRYTEIWQARHPGKAVPYKTAYRLSHMNPMGAICCVDNSKAVSDGGRLSYLGLAIQKMDECDAIIFDQDWMNHKGCRVEHEVAREYGLKIIGD